MPAHFYQQVVIIYLEALKRIVWSAGNRISMRATATGDKVGDATTFVPFIIVHVPGEDHDLSPQRFLRFLEVSGELLFWCASTVAATIRFCIAGTRVGRVMQNDEDEIN